MKRYKFLFLTLGIIGLILQIVIIRQTIEPHPSKASKQKTLRNNSIQFIQETPVKSSKNKTSVEFDKRAELVNEICDKYSDEHRPEFQGKCKINSNFKIFLFCHFQKHLLKFPGGGRQLHSHKLAIILVQKKIEPDKVYPEKTKTFLTSLKTTQSQIKYMMI